MAARDVRSFSTSFSNIRNVVRQMATLSSSLDAKRGVEGSEQAKNAIRKALKNSADALRDQAKLYSGGRVPRRVTRAIFSFYDPNQNGKENQALAGVRKGAPPRLDKHIFLQWRTRRARNPGQAARISTQGSILVGVSFARLFHQGFRSRKGVRFFSRAFFATRKRMTTILTEGYREAIRLAGLIR